MVEGPQPQAFGGAFGKYTLLMELGRGGMGVVFEAVDSELNRSVALKMLLPTSAITPEDAAQDQERFLREARVSANLPKHPHIVGVYEAGLIEGRRYIAMEFVRGRQMSAWCKGGDVPLRRQVAVLRDVALAVDHAHRHGVIHRDLKPDNVLIDAAQQPHVMDFGLAKRMTDSTTNLNLTVQGLIVGTPTYMSPEQAEGRRDVDRRTDIYSLGVMLFEIVAGRIPFQGQSPMQVLVKVIHDATPSPSAVAQSKGKPPVDPALEQVCFKALAKNRDERFATAGEFAEELTRWLEGREPASKKPLKRIPAGTRRAVVKPPAKRTAAWAAGTAGGLALVVVLAAILLRGEPAREAPVDTAPAEALLAQGRAQEALRAFEAILRNHPGDARAEAGQRKAAAKVVALLLDEADQLLAGGKYTGALVAYGKVLAREPGNGRALEGQKEADHRIELEKKNAAQAAVDAEKAKVREAAVLPAPRPASPPVVERPVPPPAPKPVPVDPPAEVKPVERTPEPPPAAGPPARRLWLLIQENREKLAGQTVVFQRPGLPDSSATIKDVTAKEVVLSVKVPGGGSIETRETVDSLPSASLLQMIHRVAPKTDADLLRILCGVLSERGDFDGAYKEVERARSGGTDPREAVELLLDREHAKIDGLKTPGDKAAALKKLLASRSALLGEEKKKALAAELAALEHPGRPAALRVQERLSLGGHEGEARSLAFSPDGRLLATGGWDKTIRLWDLQGGQPRGVMTHKGMLLSLAFSPDGKTLVGGDLESKVRVWDVASAKERFTFSNHSAQVLGVAFSSDGTIVASASTDNSVRLWEAATGRERKVLRDHPKGALSVAFSPDGKFVAAGTAEGRIQVWDLDRSEVKLTLGGHSEGVWSVAFSPDGRSLVSGGNDGTVKIWDLPSGKEKATMTACKEPVPTVAYTPDGKWVGSLGRDGHFKLWDPATGKEALSVQAHSVYARAFAFAPNGKAVATTGWSPSTKVFDLSGVGPGRP